MVIMARRPDRIINSGVVATFIDNHEVKFVFLGDSKCRGVQQFASKEGALRGTGKTMLGWVKTPGFLEQVCRNMEIRRRIRRAIAFWRM
jgi:hypothetical protein